MATSVSEYVEARAQFQKAQSEIDQIAGTVRAVADALRHAPAKFMFSNIGPGLPFEASMSQDAVSVRGDDWPSAEGIQEALSRWHVARSKMLDAWAAVPVEQREALQPPPD